MRAILIASFLIPSLAIADGSVPEWPRAPAMSGRYEGYSAIRMAPYGPLTGNALLPRWLEVTTHGNESEIVFQPDGRVRWQLVYGPHGVTEKVTLVDGEKWTRSQFHYDGRGALTDKTVTGSGTPEPLTQRYRTDTLGRVVGRDGKRERWEVAWQSDGGAVATTFLDGIVVRIDHFDPQGRPLVTALGGGPEKSRLRLLYRRDAAGNLVAVERQRGKGKPHRADGSARDPSFDFHDLRQLSGVLERWEVLALTGAPVTHNSDNTGLKRTISDNYVEGCELNQATSVTYDPSEKLIDVRAECICGACVDARAPVSGREVIGRDEHWTRGPWILLDGELSITADHRVVTPRGSIPAGALRPGDLVTTSDGGVRVLRSVERLPIGGERLGINLRTRDGTFAAGGFLVESETPRACPNATPNAAPR
jgi:hypothetical protein